LAALALAASLVGCARDKGESAPTATPGVAATAAPLRTASATSGSTAPAPTSTGAASAAADDYEWNLETEPDGPDFQIDADATAYYMPFSNQVTFKAVALNGTPPYTFTWDFGDGSPQVTGDLVKYAYPRLGRFEARVIGKDANGETSHVDLLLMVTDPKEFVERLQLDPKLYENWPTPPPSPAVTP
jgi:hypothetical protein